MLSSPTLTREVALARPREGLQSLTDEQLLAGQKRAIEVLRAAHVEVALFAAELARRSTRELGHKGLVQREGARSTEQYLERQAGLAPDEARAIVRVGQLLTDDESGSGRVVAESVAAGSVSILAADAIVAGLGDVTDTVTLEALTDAAALLVSVAPEMSIRRVGAEARALRDELDTAGVLEREQGMRERRFLHLSSQPDGMTRVAGLLDPESAAIVTAAFDQITAPRRGGPRFVDERAAQRSQQIIDDPRTNGQLLADAFVEMIRIAGAADTGRVFAQRRPAVVIRVDKHDLDTGTGAATIDGQTAAVSIATAERYTCTAGAIPVMFEGSSTIDAGPHIRHQTTRQRDAIAERDGSCLWVWCEHPPSWCEVHHAQPFSEGGPTTVANGLLLCRYHHMHVHDNKWRIIWRGNRRDGQWVAIPQPGSGQTEIPLPSKRRLKPRESLCGSRAGASESAARRSARAANLDGRDSSDTQAEARVGGDDREQHRIT